MPAKRLPTQVLEARGAYRRHPERRRDPTPVVAAPLGLPPAALSDAQRAAWGEMVDGAPGGVLTRADRVALELAACLLAELRAGSSKMQSSRIATLRHLLASFGMTPADRGSVSVPPVPKVSRLREALGDEEYGRIARTP